MIDCHVHVYPPEVIREATAIGEKEPYFALLSGGKVHKWATTEDVVSAMDRDGVDISWIFGFAFRDPGLCALCNDYVIEAVRRYPDRLKGLAVVNPLAPGVEKEVFRCKENGLSGVGELFPGGQGFDISDETQTRKLVGAASEAGMFLLFHTAEPVGHDYPGKGSTGPAEAAEFCSNHPDQRVVFAHFGGGLWMYELMPEMRRVLANAWYDTAAWPWLYEPALMRAISSAGVIDKILYGSDFPILSYGRYERILSASSLSDEDRGKVLCDNAKRFASD